MSGIGVYPRVLSLARNGTVIKQDPQARSENQLSANGMEHPGKSERVSFDVSPGEYGTTGGTQDDSGDVSVK